MLRKMTLTFCLIGSCVWCLALVAGADRDPQASATGSFEPVAPIHSLMFGQMTFFKHIGEALKEPADSERNEEIEEAAEVLAELANVNRLNKDKDDFRRWATQLRDTALELAREAGKEGGADDEQLRGLLERLKETCMSCHDVYRT